MVFKQKDSQEPEVDGLLARLRQATSGDYRSRLEKRLAMVRAGLKGEKRSAYYIDFDLKDSLNWAVIHDLRIEVNGRVAQIDHILINRLLEIYVIESKAFRTKIRYENGGWERLNASDSWQGITSPVEQNERHIFVLRDLIEAHQLAPMRLGLKPNFINIVTVQGSCSIIGKRPRNAKIERADTLVKKILKEDISLFGLLKVISQETLRSFATSLVAYHRPPKSRNEPLELRDTLETPKVKPASAIVQTIEPSDICASCAEPVTTPEISYCKANAARFAGKNLCRSCQKFAPPTKKSPPSSSAKKSTTPPAAFCAICTSPVDRDVVFYCRINARKFSHLTLCRTCQKTVPKVQSAAA